MADLVTNKGFLIGSNTLAALPYRLALLLYVMRGKKMGYKGYMTYRQNYVFNVLRNHYLMNSFRLKKPLPEGYGFGLDERVVEYPWLLSQISDQSSLVLDAGGGLNFEFIMHFLKEKHIIVYTLSPDRENHVKRRSVSYLYGDLRENILNTNSVDEIVCLSTIEHVGMDNSRYTGRGGEKIEPESFCLVMKEFYRVLKPRGKLFLTVPYGLLQDLGWLIQFDANRLDVLIKCFGGKVIEETYFKYTLGWQISDKDDCKYCGYIENKRPCYNHATAIACIVMEK